MAVKVKNKSGQRNSLAVHAPRDLTQPGAFERFVASLNGRLDQVSASLHKMPPKLPQDFDPDDFVREEDFRDLLDKVDEEDIQLLSTEGEEGGQSGVGVRRARSSRRRRIAQEEAQSAIENAVSGSAGQVAVFTADHVVNGFANFTFDAGTGRVTAVQFESTVATGTAPLIVASTTKVVNLNADLLDGLDSTAFETAQIHRALLLSSRPPGQRTARRPVAGTYGTTTDVATIIVDADGRIQAASNTPIAGVSSSLPWRHDLVMPLRRTETSRRPVAGSYGSSSAIPVLIVDANGRIQAITTAAAGASAAVYHTVLGFAPKSANGGSGTSRRPVAGSYGGTTTVPVITVDQHGRVQSITTAAISSSSGFAHSFLTMGAI